ncbi:MAG: TonB family protein [Chitinophagales bacterium]|nr:TonB family protein [Chitinophagales bacterium]
MLFATSVFAQFNTQDDDVGATYCFSQETPAEFPGGIVEMMKYLYGNFNYPEEAIEKEIEGIVVVSFMVNEDGSLGDYVIKKDIGGGCGEEVVRVLRTMPKFKPATKLQKPVKQLYNVPVRLRLPEKQMIQADTTITSESPQSDIPEEIFVREISSIEENVPVEEGPEFPGGQTALMRYVYENYKYPAEALEQNIQGLVVISFTVNEDGSLSNFEIKKDIGGGCGEEALRVAKTLPNFSKPGMQNGKPVKVQYNLPIRLKIETEVVEPQKKKTRKKKH